MCYVALGLRGSDRRTRRGDRGAAAACAWRRSTETERQLNRGCADRRWSSLRDDAWTAAQIDGEMSSARC